jgi:hypothetical protein
MEEYQKALEESLASQNSNLLNMVIFKMVKGEMYRKEKGKENLYSLMSKHEVSKHHLIQYL